MALDFVAIRTEVLARGFANMAAGADLTRVKRWVNSAMHDIDNTDAWDYLAATATGAAPLVVADMHRPEAVTTTLHPEGLIPIARREARALFGDLTLTGTPSHYYLTLGTTVNVYPVSTGTITVAYQKFRADLAADADEPLMPDRFREAIVELAAAKGWRNLDNDLRAQACLQEGFRIVQEMREFYGMQAPTAQIIYGNSEDW